MVLLTRRNLAAAVIVAIVVADSLIGAVDAEPKNNRKKNNRWTKRNKNKAVSLQSFP